MIPYGRHVTTSGGGGGGGDPLLFEGHAVSTSSANPTNTFSSFSISTPESSNRWIIVAAAPIRNSATTVTGVTIGGETATPLSSFTGNDDLACRWYAANVPTGTSVTITVTCDGSTWECAILVWSIGREPVVYDAETSTSAPSELASVSIDVPAGGDVIAFAGYRGGGSSSNYFAWTGATESSDARLFADKTYSSAEEIGLSAQTGRTVSAQLQNSTYYIQPLISVLTLEAGSGGGTTHDITPRGIATGAPRLGRPTLTPIFQLSPRGLVTGAPQLGRPTLTPIFQLSPRGLVTGAPRLGRPALTVSMSITPRGLVTGAPQLGRPTLGLLVPVSPRGLVTGAPQLGRPTLGLLVPVSPRGLVTGAPLLGRPNLWILAPSRRGMPLTGELVPSGRKGQTDRDGATGSLLRTVRIYRLFSSGEE
jgi:hypothetical protein